jgi:hypothetical protein
MVRDECEASAAFLGSGFARQPSPQSQLALSPPWQQPPQSAWAVGKSVTKNQQLHFANRQIKHLHIELRNERLVALLAWQNRGFDSKQSSDQRLVVNSKLERTTFTKMANVADGQISC